MNRFACSTIALAALAMTSVSGALAMGNVTVTTESVEAQVISGSINCPKGPYGDGFSTAFDTLLDRMPAVEAQSFLDKAGDFASQNDVTIDSSSTSTDFATQQEVATVQATGPLHDLASQLCTVASQYLQ